MTQKKPIRSSGLRVSRREALRGLLGAAATAVVAGSRPARAAAPAARAGTVSLRYQTANLMEAQYEPVWKEMFAKFEAQNPNIKVEPILVARKDHWTKFVTAAKANQAPDVVSVDIATAAYYGYLRPIDDLWQAEPSPYRQAWSPDILKAATWKGALYGLPSWGGIYGEIYNTELVKQAGLDMSRPPATWKEYLEWAKRLTREGQQWALAILGGRTDSTTRMLLMWIWSNGGEAFNPNGLTAAHKYLPIPAFVQVTNLQTHTSIIVRVNDRGPFPSDQNPRSGDRIIDLSVGVAKRLGFYAKGTALVRVEAIQVKEE